MYVFVVLFAYWEMAAYNMFSKYKYLIFNLVFSHLGFWSGNFSLIAHFPDHCLLVPFLNSGTLIILYTIA